MPAKKPDSRDNLLILTDTQFRVLSRINANSLSGGPQNHIETKAYLTMKGMGLVTYQPAGIRVRRVGSASGNSWYDLTPRGKLALGFNRILRGQMPTGHLDAVDLNTIAAALIFYHENGMGEPSRRSDRVHHAASGEDGIGREEISSDQSGIQKILDRVQMLRKMMRYARSPGLSLTLTKEPADALTVKPVKKPVLKR